jgi:DNA helicase-2/ATP-dependent DNA helicase PcrA
VDAPAGHGKTEQAVRAAVRAAASLPGGCEVLFLTHTNAARTTFNQRLGRMPAAMKTIHCLAGEIVDLYAGPLGLPRPLQPVNGLPTFDAMVGLAVDILGRRPEVARGLALRHPLILVDEYQDCSVDQAALVWAIAGAAPTRLRLFGDDLQAIFEFTGSQVDWGDLTASHPSVALETPWRWSRQPAMGRFLLEARRALLAGNPVDLRAVPACVTVRRWAGDVPSPHQEGHADSCLAFVREHKRFNPMVLTLNNSNALGLRKKLAGFGSYHEGSDHDAARKVLAEVDSAAGDARELILLLVRTMHQWGTGMTKPYRDQAEEVFRGDGATLGAKKKLAEFAQMAGALYTDPSTATWLACIRKVVGGAHGVPGWKVLRGDPLFLLASVRPSPDRDSATLLHEAARARDAVRRNPGKGFMTVHKAKGLEFGTVVIPYCAGSHFPDDIPHRRRIYVAMSRAQSRLVLLVPENDPTPLLRLK